MRARDDARRTITQDPRDLTFESLVAKVERLEERIRFFRDQRGPTPPLPADLDAANDRVEELRRMLEDQERSVESLGRARDIIETVTDAGPPPAGEASSRRSPAASTTSSPPRGGRSEADDDEFDGRARRRAASRRHRCRLATAKVELAVSTPTPSRRCSRRRRRTRAHPSDRSQCHDDHRDLLTPVTLAMESGPSASATRPGPGSTVSTASTSASRRAPGAELLHATDERRRNDGRHSYHAPLRERIERFGRLVFGVVFAVEPATT